MKFHSVQSPDLEPRLAAALNRYRAGLLEAHTVTDDGEVVHVFIRTDDPASLATGPGVALGAQVKLKDGHTLVTARVDRKRIPELVSRDDVVTVQAATPIRPALWATRDDLGSDEPSSGGSIYGGKGVVVGIIDYGCDFAHMNFRNADGTTRIEALWDQNGNPNANSPYQYGRLHTRADIDSALGRPQPYGHLGHFPGQGSHGTHVMDIAAGNGRGTDNPGVAPEADIVFVNIAHADLAFGGPDVVGQYFGDSVQLAEAIAWIFEQAGDRPCVINISLGTNGGPHDGTSLVERWIDDLIAQRPNRAVVIAASNSFDDGIHAGGSVTQGGQEELEWHIQPDDKTHNELEIWYSGQDRFLVEILAPGGGSLGSLNIGDSGEARDGNGNVLLFGRHAKADNGDHTFGLFMNPTSALPNGRWTIRLHGTAVVDGDFHAWIERDDRGQSTFGRGRVDSHTLGSISCGYRSIVVGSYDAHVAGSPLSYFSSAGPTRDGREKPEVSAPGHKVSAARSGSLSGNGSTRKSGTSMAAPAVTGVVATMFEAAAGLGRSLDIDTLRQLLAASARTAVGGGWHTRYGQGKVSVVAAVNAVEDWASRPPAQPDDPSGAVALTSEGGQRPPEPAPPDGAGPASTDLPAFHIRSGGADSVNQVKGGLKEQLAAGDHEMVKVFVRLADEQDVPAGLTVRARGADDYFTAEVAASRLEEVSKDDRVLELEVARQLSSYPESESR